MTPQGTEPEFWHRVLDIMAEGLMLVENGGRIIFVNRAMELLTGYSRDELIGKTCAALAFDCARRPPAENRGPCALFKNGRSLNRPCTLRRKDGTHVTVLKNAQVLTDDKGEVLCAVEVQSDLTQVEQKEQELLRLRRILGERDGFCGIVGASSLMERLFDLVRKAAASDAPVLIYGESGTGKELVAAAIHDLGGKRSGPFIRVNCGALSESLLESELFGHVRGSFTGADTTTKGRFEAAHTGDIFLDEVGDVPLSTQVKLLRVIQEKEFERVGDYRPIRIDVRVIAATHRDLRLLVKQGQFREDLFYRLNVIPILIPPLRERREDIPLLVGHFVKEIAAKTGKKIVGVDREAMAFLTNYIWPGNVRELINAIEYAFVVCSGQVITLSDLPEMGLFSASAIPALELPGTEDECRQRLIDALITAQGSRTAAARILGVSRQTVWSWIKKYCIDVKELT